MSDGYELGTAKTIEKVIRGVNNLNNAQITEELTTVFQIEPKALALKRDVWNTSNGGSVSFDPSFGEKDVIGVETDGSEANSSASVETAQILDYKSGLRNSLGIRVRVLGGAPDSGFAEWGLGEEESDNEIKFRQTSDGTVSAVIEREGIKTEVPETEWSNTNLRDFQNENGDVEFQVCGFDPFDGTEDPTSTLGSSLDTSFGYIYKIDYVWYGQGILVFNVLVTKESGEGVIQEKRPLVAFVPKETTSLPRINFPAFARANNDGTSGNTQITVAGRQGSYAGKRASSDTKLRHVIENPPTISSDGYTTVLLARRKNNFRGIPADISRVGVAGGGTYDLEVRGRVSVTGTPSPQDPSRVNEDPSPLEVSESGSIDTSNGTLTGYVSGGSPPIISGSGIFSIKTGEIENQINAFVREEWAGIALKEISAGTSTTPDSIVIELNSSI